MELKWARGGGGDVDLYNDGRFVGWVERVGCAYGVHIVHRLSSDAMPCEKVRYVTVRDAMRALKATVTVLLLGESYGL